MTPESIEYDPELFLEMAEKYREGSLPGKRPDLIQSSEKLWLAAAYTVKIYFLKLQDSVLLDSHRSLRFFCRNALKMMENVLNEQKLFNIWKLAEKYVFYFQKNWL